MPQLERRAAKEGAGAAGRARGERGVGWQGSAGRCVRRSESRPGWLWGAGAPRARLALR